MAKYLVTGGAGFIGSNLTAELVKQGNDVFVIDDLSMGKIENLVGIDKNKIQFCDHSITDYNFMQHLLLEKKFDYIVLLAAVASVADSIERPYETHLVNQEANVNILEIVRKYKLPVKKIIFSSSAAVYGNLPDLPKKETSRVDPLTPYAIDKFASERFVINYGRLYNIPTVATRFFNVYGPKQNPQSPYSGVLSIITECLRNNQTFTLYGDGKQERDFIYVADVVKALILLLQSDAKHRVYNVATGKTNSLLEVIHKMEAIAGKSLRMTTGPERTGDIKYSQADISELGKLGFVADNDLGTGLEKYLKYEKI